ncbi:Abi-alpha family protein [Atlantibacter hermannii]|uniref:Abi-alpha family protein n=1 Tax=Atlantibacter hermannii TaxID=565 RepID=UPI002FFC084E
MDKEIEEIIKTVPKEVWLQVYGDGVKGPLAQFGKFGEQLIKTLRVLTYPLQVAAHKQDLIDLRFARALDTIPSDKRTMPPASLVLEIADKLRFHPEDSVISELYVDLLSSSMNSDKVQKAHPAFIHLIGQLSSDEALFLLLISTNKFSTYVRRIDDWKLVERNERERFFSNSAFIDDDGRVLLKDIAMKPEDFYYPENFYTYIDHLRDLGLIEYFNHPKLKIHQEFGCGGYDYWFIGLSKFGTLFFECCSRGLGESYPH